MLNIDDLKSKIEELSRDLDRKQKEYNALFEEMNTGFAFHKIILTKSNKAKDFVFLKINKEFERQTGLKSDNIMGSNGLEVFPKLDKNTIELYGKVALGHGPARFELYLPDIEKYFDVNAYSPFKNFFVTTFYDITKRKKADLLIAESEWKYRSVFENIREGMVFNEIVRNKKGSVVDYKILDVNESYEKMSHFKRGQMIGKLATEVYGMTSRQVSAEWKKYNNFSKHELIEYQDKKTGKYYKVSINLLDKDKFVTIYSDVTELIEAKNQAEESDKLKSSFLTNMSHEIRTPLNGILGYTDILTFEDDEKKRKNYLDIIKNSGQQLLDIVNDIVDISKIEAGNIEIRTQRIDIAELLEELRSSFSDDVRAKKLKFSIHNEIPAKEYVVSDGAKIHQVLSNLVKNAIKFTDHGSISIHVTKKGEYYHFKVSDTGIGIDPKYHKIIFDRFRQVEIKGDILRGGNGLGLSISQAFIEAMGGEIWVESKSGKGSSFIFRLPVKS